MTRDELPGCPQPWMLMGDGPHYWTNHRSHASIRYMSLDKGETWHSVGINWADQRARQEEHALEMHRIQTELK